MKVACFTMMRNESAILNPFLDQLDEFFDRAIILDHGSTDDSMDVVRQRYNPKISTYRLQSSGYPQAEVATYFARRLFVGERPDFIFFLDCDEYLPFSTRGELEAFLQDNHDADILRLFWLNVAPTRFDGTDVFRSLVRSPEVSTIPKIVVSSRILRHEAPWSIHQGYHGVHAPGLHDLRVTDITEHQLLHIPVQSRTQLMFKLAAGSTRLRREKTNLRKGQGYHWVDLAKEIVLRPLSDSDLLGIALGYPKSLDAADLKAEPLLFTFPYISSDYRETSSSTSGQIQGLMTIMEETGSSEGKFFSIMDANGEIMTTSKAEESTTETTAVQNSSFPLKVLPGNEPAEMYASLIEPLFNLPAKLPITAWGGHIPFLFLLFRAMKPKTYVELGVHNGASLIAASTAASTYNLPTRLSGVDTWQGDAHAGFYHGDQLYEELRTYLAAAFPNAHLVRSLFSDAIQRFNPGSIDILHIDGLHSYDAVKEDFTTWLDRLSPSGVILFHDISVFDRGFGVHRLWAELKEKFTTLEFHHSAGLGVLLLDPERSDLHPILSIAKDPTAWRLYQSLVADIANTLPERMEAFKPAIPHQPQPLQPAAEFQQQVEEARRQVTVAQHAASEAESQLAALHASTSWRMTAPVRAIKRLLGGR